MSKPLISVIVPVYKVEPYLERCVDSIRNQTYQNLEIILIDDGSPDRCGEMCDGFAKEDPRIRVIHKENGGQSSARNLGLDIMKGEYVGFVDSDDSISLDMYERLYDLLQKNGADISACGSVAVHSSGKVQYLYPAYPKDKQVCVFSMKQSLRENLMNQRITYSLWDKLYRREIFDGLRMTEGKIYEDMEIMPKCLERSEIVVYDPAPLYYYSLSQNSTLRSNFRPERFREAEVALEKAKDFQVRYPDLYNEAMGRYLSICMSTIHASRGVESCFVQRKEMICQLRRKFPKDWTKTLSRNEKIKLTALRICPTLYEWLMLFNDIRRRGLQ